MGIDSPHATKWKDVVPLRLYTSTPVGYFWKNEKGLGFYRSAFSGLTIHVFPHDSALFYDTKAELEECPTPKLGFSFTIDKFKTFVKKTEIVID